ncbi:MAG: Vitamin B12 import ATP-binding protein BtuD [Steroidobacteraceae bacterium]|nr:Vitamin B12 import ATP-binding protein BtuD [Steroidobacteraceae bacterium]
MIKTERLTRRYESITAVENVSFEVKPGEVLGFLGPNGAGKTTTMRMIAGFIAPSEGTASICGHDIEREPLAAKAALGYLPEGAPSYGEMSVRGFLGFIADLRGLEGAARRTRLERVIDRLALGSVAAQTIDTLSKGFRRRVGIAQAILHDPPVLVLDEPTDGLDPNQKHEVRALINEMAAEKTIVVSTHILEEVDAVCTRAIIIARGRIVADDTPQGLAARSRYHNAVTLRLERAEQMPAARAALTALPQVAGVEVDGQLPKLTALPRDGAPLLAEVNALAAREHIALQSLELEAGRLDEVFRSITA